MIQKINNLYDSHVHLRMTGEMQARLDLSNLKSSHDLKALPVSQKNYQGHWLVGFGWDEWSWPEGIENLNKEFLDSIFPNHPVLFSRKDGHKAWVNSMALNEVPQIKESDQCLKNSHGEPTGVLLENAHYEFLRKIPSFSQSQQREHIQFAQTLFNQSGFTHVRDMSTSIEQWKQMKDLESSKKLSLYVKCNFICDRLSELNDLLGQIKNFSNEQTQQLSVEGVKIFYDGSLGSETALLSKSYPMSSGHGVRLWQKQDFKSALKAAWGSQLDMSVHVIGDQAVDEVVDIAREVSAEGTLGRLQLEHVQVVRPETIAKMKSLHVTCHMQPCHFLSDQIWLKEKLASLYDFTFPWESLRKAKIPIFFGSDSPIEFPSLFRNLKALKESEKCGIPKLQAPGYAFHQISQKNGEETTFTLLDLEKEKILEVWFRGQKIL